MKTMTSVALTALFILSVVLFGCGKKDDTTQTKKDDKTTTQNQTQTQQQTQNNTATSPKIGAIWTQVEKKNEELGKTIKEGKGHHLDEPIDEVMNLVKTLPGKSTGLEQSKIDVVKSKISEMEKIAKNLDKLHHDNKKDDLNKEYEKFNQLLKDIKGQYPAESFN